MRCAALAIALVLCEGCGGQSAVAPTAKRPVARVAPAPDPIDDPVPEPERLPIEVLATTAREGTLLRVDVAATGRGYSAGELFEQPASWQLEARMQGEALKLLVRGPVRVERAPAGSRSWNIDVAFSVYFQLPGTGGLRPKSPKIGAALADAPVELALTAPGEATPTRFSLPAPIASR